MNVNEAVHLRLLSQRDLLWPSVTSGSGVPTERVGHHPKQHPMSCFLAEGVVASCRLLLLVFMPMPKNATCPNGRYASVHACKPEALDAKHGTETVFFVFQTAASHQTSTNVP